MTIGVDVGVDVVRAGWRELGGAIPMAHGRWEQRRGLVFAVRDADGRRGLGEASPLPGVSRESLADCRRALARAVAALPVKLDGHEAIGAFAARHARGAAAARCAIETAMLALLAGGGARTGRGALGRERGGHGSAAEFAGGCAVPPKRRAISAICEGEPVPVLASGDLRRGSVEVAWNAIAASADEARAAVARGVGCIKVKVGAAAFEDDLARLAAIREAIGARVGLRADANRGWPDAALGDHLARLAPLGLEYVEEPIAGGGRSLVRASGPMPVPVALDESLADDDAEAWLDEVLSTGRASVLVLKPMLLGGPLRCLELAARARAAGAEIVVTHLLDGPIALAATRRLAVELAPTLACGLDAHPGLAAWPALDDAALAPSEWP